MEKAAEKLKREEEEMGWDGKTIETKAVTCGR